MMMGRLALALRGAALAVADTLAKLVRVDANETHSP